MSKWKQFLIALKDRSVLVLIILSFSAMSSFTTYLVTRYYDYQSEILKLSSKNALLEVTVNKLQASLGGNYKSLQEGIRSPVLYEAEPLTKPQEVPIETPDDRPKMIAKKVRK
jgi:hypothetical protein